MSCSDPIAKLYAVVMTTSSGSTVEEIKLKYRQCCGKDIDLTELGFSSLQELLQFYSERFYCKGNKWFGYKTKANENLVQIIAAGKKPRGRPRQITPVNNGRFCSYPMSSRVFDQSTPRYNNYRGKVVQRKISPLPITRRDRSSSGDPAFSGFGNKSFNNVRSRSSSTISSETSSENDGLHASNYVRLPSQPTSCITESSAKLSSNAAKGVADNLPCLTGLTSVMHRDQQNQDVTNEEEYTSEILPIYNAELPRKIFDLLRSKGCGLSVREISEQLAIPQAGSLTPSGQVGVAVKLFPRTFSLSSNSGNGVVEIVSGALRPDYKDCGQNDRRRENGDPRHPKAGKRDAETDYLCSRFSSVSSGEYSETAARETYARKALDTEQQVFDNKQGFVGNVRSYVREGNLLPRNPNLSGCLRATKSESSFIPVHWNVNAYYRGRFEIPCEPRKFERTQRTLDNFLGRYEHVKLTCFCSLDEFYVRWCCDEKSYEMMLEQLRYDYKGSLDSTPPQLWMKGDGAAVWFDRKWQRGVVYATIETQPVHSVNVFLIDVGRMVTLSIDQLVPLHHHYYLRAPFALCCSIGEFDIVHKKRLELIYKCKEIVDRIMESGNEMCKLSMQVLGKIRDEKEKLLVRLMYCDGNEVDIPRYFVEKNLITLRQYHQGNSP